MSDTWSSFALRSLQVPLHTWGFACVHGASLCSKATLPNYHYKYPNNNNIRIRLLGIPCTSDEVSFCLIASQKTYHDYCDDKCNKSYIIVMLLHSFRDIFPVASYEQVQAAARIVRLTLLKVLAVNPSLCSDLNKEHLKMASSGMLCGAALVKTDVSEELRASFIRVTRIGELGITLGVTSNRRALRKSWKLRRMPSSVI
jgi:hypothetical protein